MSCGCHRPPPPHKGPSEYIPSHIYPDPFVHIGPGYVPMHGPGHLGPGFPCCHPHPFPVPDTHTPDPECECPPKIYRNPPDATVLPGDHITVEKDADDPSTTYYTVSAVQFPVAIDPASADALYGDGTPEHPLGIDDFEGATSREPGKSGAVPAPAPEDRTKYLRGNGTWAEIVIPEQVNADWTAPEGTAAYIRNKPGVYAEGVDGFVPGPSAAESGMFLRGDGTWADVDNTMECDATEMNEWLDEV